MRVYFVNFMIRENRSLYNVNVVFNLINRIIINFRVINKFIEIVQNRYIKTLRRFIIRNDNIVINFVDTISKKIYIKFKFYNLKVIE